MKQASKTRDPWILHPFFFSVYSALILWLANIDQIRAITLLRPLLFSLAFCCILLLVGRLVFRGWLKAAIFTTFIAILFFSYGHVFQLIDMKAVNGFIYGRHRYLLPVYLLALVAGTIWIVRLRPPLTGVTHNLNLMGGFLLLALMAQIGFALLRTPQLARVPADTQPAMSASAAGLPERDVYYIILDAYGRQDVLKDHAGPDTSDFLQQLRELGFVIQDCAQSNYAWTALSLGSSLNMDYLENLGIPMDPSDTRINYWDFVPRLHNSQVREQFEMMGYQFVTFKTVYAWMDITDSDIYYDAEKTGSFMDRQEALNFYYLFLRTTAMRFVIEVQEYSPEQFDRLPPVILQLINPRASLLSSRHFKQYEQNLYAMEKLAEIPQLPGKKFVYAHLFVTHQPYVFNQDGSLRWPILESREAYYDQIIYANKRMVEILKTIINTSSVPPVIILQGDHSYEASGERVKILNAYYLPDGGDQALYPELTPVNTFRLIFNQYFGGQFSYLPDRSYYAPNTQPYQFELIPPSCVP